MWNFEKRYRLDHDFLCLLVDQFDEGCDQLNGHEPDSNILDTLELRVACDLCLVKERETTCIVRSVNHACHRKLLLVKTRTSDKWRPVSKRPTHGQFGSKVQYQKCTYFVEGPGCGKHGQTCNFARSHEEAAIWNYMKDNNIDKEELIRLVIKAESDLKTPTQRAESILKTFPGEFLELCKDCFLGKPQKLTSQRCNAHHWDPILVHRLSEKSDKHVYSQIRPLPQNCRFDYCRHVLQGKLCWHQPGSCMSAQSQVEMAVWKAEYSGLFIRPLLLQSSQSKPTESSQILMYCKVCLLELPSPESFFLHCSSVEHAQLLSADTTTQWTGRPPPHNRHADFLMCQRPQTCEYGDNCPRAHCEEELQEWIMRAAEKKQIRQNIEAQGLMTYNEKLLEEYRNSSAEENILSEQADDVRISCDENLTLESQQINVALKWNFKVETERQLVHVALLKQEPGALFTIGESFAADECPVLCIYSEGQPFLSEDGNYDITISFTSIHPGLYEQWLVLDFGMRPLLLKKLEVRIGQPTVEDKGEEQAFDPGATFQSSERWHSENRVIIPCLFRTEVDLELLKKYKPPQNGSLPLPRHNSRTPLNHENYKERMHIFLYTEEQANDKLVSGLNVCGEMTAEDTLDSIQFGMKKSPSGQVFLAVSVPCSLTPDTPEGQVLKRSIQSALVAPLSPNSPNPKVYEARILKDTISENKMYLQLSKNCCSDLALESNESYQMEVQFVMYRLSFCTMHNAVDGLTDMKCVLPDLKNCGVPVNGIRCEKLNTKQRMALDFITGNSNDKKSVAPLLIYGPFGTGKTLTLATAARELCKQPKNKVLICTHTNSSADLYVKDHLHPFMNNSNNVLRPVRIKANKDGIKMSSTDEITLKYCHLSADGQTFLEPTKDVLDEHNIVITTAMAVYFQDLKLPKGYFTHILIDEASQMLECEALIALRLSGPNTKIVLAGDHMQMGPKLFSIDDHHRSNHTLLNRLFHYYQEQKCDAAKNSRIIFSENYRSTKEIVDFVSTHFYVGKNDVIQAVGNIPTPSNGSALKFHHIRGQCLPDTESMTWFNKEEVNKVVEEVVEILSQWPSTWGPEDPSLICVLSEGAQVRAIRSALKRVRLGRVTVENTANVQGKQFRVIILTTVHTRDSLKISHLHGLELFNDARVLNTAMTRAQSCVVVVGDASALCCFGKCSGIWKRYVDHCISNNSVAPQHFTKGYFEKDVMEIAKFQKSEQEDDSNKLDDAILQEMTEEYERHLTEYMSDKGEMERPNHHISEPYQSYNSSDFGTGLPELCKRQPDIYKQGKLIKESHNKGYVIPFLNPSRIISIKGQQNLGQAFTGDEVVLQTTNPTKVISITKQEESSRILECQLEDEDHSKKEYSESIFVKRTMIPITKSAPKIRILLLKKRRNFLPIWKKIDGRWEVIDRRPLNENLKQTNVFVVQVISWGEQYYYPLGYVIEILPIGKSLDDGLRILNKEFKVSFNRRKSLEGFSLHDEDGANRKDICDIHTFTVDPKGAQDLDDAISVQEVGDKYKLGIHIADVVSFVRKDSKLDEDAKQQGITYYNSGKKHCHMFPEELCTAHFSLLQNQVRNVVSLMIMVDRQTNKIDGKPIFQLSKIKSNRQFTYEEAEEIISKRYGNIHRLDTIEDCVRVAHGFAKVQRKERLLDWAYCQTDDDRLPGKRKAHLMIEELSVLFNKLASENLTKSAESRSCTPLRCQARPDPEKLEEFKESNFAELIPLSFKVQHRVEHNDQTPDCGSFPILTKVWKDIQSAARMGDVDKMVDIIAADDIHPLLQPMTNEFRRCLSKAYIICSNSCLKATVGHYSLNVKSYTHASSPIRRYMDVILQRLLHAFICKRNVQYGAREISELCQKFERDMRKAKEYEEKSEQINYAVTTKQQSAPKLAFVINADPNRDHFAATFPFNKNVFTERLQIMYKHLQLWDQPLYDEKNNSITLSWKRRIYKVDSTHMSLKVKQPEFVPLVEVPIELWREVINAIETESWDMATSLIVGFKENQKDKSNNLQQSAKNATNQAFGMHELKLRHEVDINITLKPGDTLNVQMTSEINRGYHMPALQLVCIKPDFEICVEHINNDVTCFSRSAERPSRIQYSDTNEYTRIWRPICEMESVTTAIKEGDSIVIENLVVQFQRKKELLNGSFFLPQALIDEWELEFELSKCLLCIRKRGLKLEKTLNHAAVIDPEEFTWVAHGATSAVEKKKGPPKGSSVQFNIHHLPMDKIPDGIFQEKTPFTVEIIPKKLPNIRMESAVISVPTACTLVKAIALGQRLPREVQIERNFPRTNQLTNDLPDLNQSQRQAVIKALNENFTLVWGPPGTGKTIVGVYMVCGFFVSNSEKPRRFKEEKDKNKQDVILYCGPSNKSVDVVAEYLLKVGSSLRTLRAYSQHVEMLDYPYPESTLQFSRKAFRQEHAKPKLRNITLHHRMRQDTNPFSAKIKAFDQRIQDVLNKKQKLLSIEEALTEKEKLSPTLAVLEEIRELHSQKLALGSIQDLTEQEVKDYKELLRDARIHEYKQHDIILCTCTQSSNPTLTKTVSARQIIIDECGMATEPQALIPLVFNSPERIVLIGDPKQLRPVVTNVRAKKLGLAKSLFERYFETHRQRVMMLNEQYRMHEDICEFPSQEFYEGRLKTAEEQPRSILCVDNRSMPVVFGHIEGKAISLIVNTAKGNENSKANMAERDKVIDIAEKLVSAKIKQQSIVILSPYNAQVAEIKEELKKKKMDQINVTTISKSQGSEWRYVIISTVCSLPSDQIEEEPDGAFLSKHLGFVGDANQINVAITRAKEGLCVIGNQKLLYCNKTWRSLLQHYSSKQALTDAENISVFGAR